MSDTKTILGQPWINKDGGKDRLVQEQITFTVGAKDATTETIVLIEDIWDNLTGEDSGEYQYKSNGKGYFYWEIDMTDMENDDATVKVKIECPKPKEGLFMDYQTGELVEDSEINGGDLEDDSIYSVYWFKKFKQAKENADKYLAIQRKEVTFTGTTYVSQDGSSITTDDIVYKNSDLGDITNLLSLF